MLEPLFKQNSILQNSSKELDELEDIFFKVIAHCRIINPKAISSIPENEITYWISFFKKEFGLEVCRAAFRDVKSGSLFKDVPYPTLDTFRARCQGLKDSREEIRKTQELIRGNK